MSNVAYATVQIIPSAQGFLGALQSQLGPGLATGGVRAGETMGRGMQTGMQGAVKAMGTMLVGSGLLAGVKTFVSSSLDAFGEFERSMNQTAAATGAPQEEMDKLSALALKFGADTKFSAGEAADAMLELAKGGFSPAQIEAGALASTLNLAAAGGQTLTDAAGSMTAAMTTFGISADESAQISNALAGAANASAADVSDMAQALAQVGAQASQSGLSLQDTAGALAVFANNGVKGSDAGTSLKVMLQRLIPQTDKAKDAMKDLGLNFVDAQGRFKPIGDIAEQLHTKLGKLTEAQRAQALQTIFGSDASRAAGFLMKAGAKGVKDMTDAASDQTAAQKMADASMKGWAGTIEKLTGAWESFKVMFGQFIAPAIEPVLNGIGTAIDFITKHANVMMPIIAVLIGAITLLGIAMTAMGVAMFFAAAAEAAVLWPVLLIVAGVVALIAAIVLVIKFHKQIGAFFVAVWDKIWTFMKGIGAWFAGPFLTPFKAIGAFFASAWQAVAGAVLTGWNAVVNFFTVTIPAAFNAVLAWFAALPGQIWAFIQQIPALMLEGLKAIAYAIGFGIGLIIGVLIHLPGWIWDLLTSLWTKATEIVTAGVQAVLTWFTNLATQAVAFVTAMPGKIWALITSLWTTATTLVRDGVITVLVWWSNFVRDAIAYVTALPGRIWALLQSIWNTATSIVSGGVSAVLKFFQEAPGKAYDFLKSLPGKIWDALKDAITKATTIGGQIIDGLIKGITDAAGKVWDTITGIANKIKEGFADALSIFSPSRVFRGFGDNIVQGLVVGINRKAGSAVKAVRDLAGDVAAVPMGLSGPGIAGALAGAGAGSSRTLNYYAAPGSGLSSEEDLFAAGERARMVW